MNKKQIKGASGRFFDREGLVDHDATAGFILSLTENADTQEKVERALDIINYLLDGYGVEAVRGEYVDQYYLDVNILYINMGDTYVPTILYDTLECEFHARSWGDYVDQYPERFD